jgi:hypothetical protein
MDASVGEAFRQGVFGYGAVMIVSALCAGLIWAVVYVLDHLHHRRQAAAVATPVQITVAPEPPQVDEKARIAAVIGAAVYAVLGAHRLVYIGESRPNVGWSTTGRTIHQTSHMPRRAPKG